MFQPLTKADLGAAPAAAQIYCRPTCFVDRPHELDDDCLRIADTMVWFAAWHISLRDDGGINVINKGYNPDREMWQKTEGKAYFTGDPSRAALKVSFFGPFYGGYNVIALDREYRHALVCGPDRDYLWILSRTPTISDEMKQQMLAIATREGFEVNKLIWVKQPGA